MLNNKKLLRLTFIVSTLLLLQIAFVVFIPRKTINTVNAQQCPWSDLFLRFQPTNISVDLTETLTIDACKNFRALALKGRSLNLKDDLAVGSTLTFSGAGLEETTIEFGQSTEDYNYVDGYTIVGLEEGTINFKATYPGCADATGSVTITDAECPYCGDGACDDDETYLSCPEDCDVPSPLEGVVELPDTGSNGLSPSLNVLSGLLFCAFGLSLIKRYAHNK